MEEEEEEEEKEHQQQNSILSSSLSARWGHPSTRYEKRRCTDATREVVCACAPVRPRAQQATRERVAAQNLI